MDWIETSTELKQLITSEQAWHYSIIPKSNGSSLSFYVDKSKFNSDLQNELELLFGKRIKLDKKGKEIIQKSLSKYYRRNGNTNQSAGTQTKVFNQTNEDFLSVIIEEAHQISSSDIHIECYKEKARVRFRIDGKLIEKYTIAQDKYPALINKIKIKANLDIAEKRLPQDGRIFYEMGTQSFDIRVSSLPSLHGEKIVMRLLSKSSTDIDIKELGFQEKQLKDYLKGLKKTHGIVLISGPTGSGKTTTLYATLKILNDIDTNILTVEGDRHHWWTGNN